MSSKNLEKKSFKDLYLERKSEPTPARRFIMEVAELTDRNEQTVRMWLMGSQVPDSNVSRTIGNHFNVDPETLFEREQVTSK